MEQSQWAPKPVLEEEKTSALSAQATPFSPSQPPPDASSLSSDYFAQTGASQDDLFDGITPISDSMRVRSEDDLFNEDFTPVAQPVVQPAVQPQSRGRGDGLRSRARGRGRGRGDFVGPRGGGLHEAGGAQARSVEQNGQTQPQSQPESTAPENAPKGPRKEGVPSVRGDRQAAGGAARPKLTEEELAEKMASIKLKNASLTAAHARAEADAASFAQREEEAKKVATRRQKEERKDRQQMMGEREKNRMRKLKAMEGREWDAEKNEDDFQRGGRFDKKGNFAGDQEEYTDGREYLYKEPRGGATRGRGAGRGDRGQKQQSAPRQEDFPALPAAPQTVVSLRIEKGLHELLACCSMEWIERLQTL